ncbi:MAG: dihydropteroate synthase [Paramuribaculum sp.]|nr:dihydropteroate synthase [Paramuribaculum sp.]
MAELRTKQFNPFSLNLKGRLLEVRRPVVMGIINATPDSFFEGSRTGVDSDSTARRAEKLVADGADWIDVGAYSSRPGADEVTADEETERLAIALSAVRKAVGSDIPVSVDTFRASVAGTAVRELGADIINDIAAGQLDPMMFQTVAELRVPYIIMHMRGTPATMQTLTDYGESVVREVICTLQKAVRELALLGVADVIVDPGFGFAKTLDQNYELMANLALIGELTRCPVLVGISRKSMLTRLLGITPGEALNATTALHVAALLQGASVLRVHDPLEAAQAVAVVERLTC